MKNTATQQVARFCVVGIYNAAITYIALYLLTQKAGMTTQAANMIGYVIVLVHSFAWSRLWVFKPGNLGIVKEFIAFTLTFLAAYTLQFIVFHSMTELGGLNKYWSNLAGLIVFGATNFLINKYYTFKHKSE